MLSAYIMRSWSNPMSATDSTTDGSPVINEPEVDPLKESELKKSQITVSRKTAKK